MPTATSTASRRPSSPPMTIAKDIALTGYYLAGFLASTKTARAAALAGAAAYGVHRARRSKR